MHRLALLKARHFDRLTPTLQPKNIRRLLSRT